MRAAIITVSTAVARGGAQDVAGPRLADLARDAGAEVLELVAVPDDLEQIAGALRRHVQRDVELVLTVGGTGLTPDDVTPEATRAVIDREAPGFAEALRAESVRRTPMGMLTRGVAGVARRTLIINLPGSPRAVEELFGVLAPALGHATEVIRSAGGSRALHAGGTDGGA